MGEMIALGLQMRVKETEKKERRRRMRIRNILQDCHYQSNSHAKEQRETFEWVSALLRSDQIVH